MKAKSVSAFIFSVATSVSSTAIAPCFNTPSTPAAGGTWVVKYITDFGAVPDDACNDQYAFEAAAAYFNARNGHGELVILAGTYIVGRQDPDDDDWYLAGFDVLHLEKCESMIIRGERDDDGERRTTLVYDDCLSFGVFDPSTGNRYLASGDPECIMGQGAYGMAAHLGTCIDLTRCANVTVKDLIIDGNSDRLIIGGKFGDTGIQLEGDGIGMKDCWYVSLEGLDVFEMARDGVGISALKSFSHFDDLNISITESSFNWSGRNGMSWTGGWKVHADHTDFNHSGQGYIHSPPMAGLDIEYEGEASIYQGSFTYCRFMYNRYWGVISDASNTVRMTNTGDFNFTQCDMVASDNGIALRANAPEMSFDVCRVYGTTLGVFGAQRTGVLSDGTRFTDCYFSEEYNGESLSPSGIGAVLFHSGDWAGGLRLEACELHTYANMQGFYLDGGNTTFHVMIDGLSHTDHDGDALGRINRVTYLSQSTWDHPAGFAQNYIITPNNTNVYFLVAGSASVPIETVSEFEDPSFPSLPVTVDCLNDPLAILCTGHPNESCGAGDFPCCPPCYCNLMVPALTCSEVFEQPSRAFSSEQPVSLGASSTLSLIPNPARDQVRADWSGELDDADELVVSDALGHIVLQRSSLKADPVLNTAAVPSGMYHCALWRKGARIGGARLLIVR